MFSFYLFGLILFPRELRPGVPVVARIPPQGPEVAALGLGAPPAVVAAPTACSPPGAGPRKLRAQPGSAARRHEREVLLGERRAKTRCATSRGPSQGRGVRVEDMTRI